MTSEALLIPLIVLGFPIVFGGMWCFVVLLIGQLSGWTKLGRQYRVAAVTGGQTLFRMRLGLGNYKGVARLDPGADGLGMDVFGLFRPGHPPLRIPWTDVRFGKRSRSLLLGDLVELRLGPDAVRLLIPASAWENLSAEAARHGITG